MVLFFLRLSIRQIRRPHNEFHLLLPMLLRLHIVRSLIFPLVAKAPACHSGQEAQCLHRKASPFLPELSKNLRGHSLRSGGPSYRKREDNELALFASWCLVGTSGSPLKAGLLYWVDTCSFCRDLTWKPKATSAATFQAPNSRLSWITLIQPVVESRTSFSAIPTVGTSMLVPMKIHPRMTPRTYWTQTFPAHWVTDSCSY